MLDDKKGGGVFKTGVLIGALIATLASSAKNVFVARRGKTKKAHATLHKTHVRKLYRRVWRSSGSNVSRSRVLGYIHPEHILIDPSNPNPVPGVEAYCTGVSVLRQALPSIKMCIDDMIEQGCKVAVQLGFEGGFGEKEGEVDRNSGDGVRGRFDRQNVD